MYVRASPADSRGIRRTAVRASMANAWRLYIYSMPMTHTTANTPHAQSTRQPTTCSTTCNIARSVRPADYLQFTTYACNINVSTCIHAITTCNVYTQCPLAVFIGRTAAPPRNPAGYDANPLLATTPTRLAMTPTYCWL